MKPIVMTQEAEIELLKKFAGEFKKELDKFNENMNDTKFTMSISVNQELKDKITILYTQSAYLKMHLLVDYYDTEVGWYGLVEKINDRLYRVYDVRLCKQYVNGAKVDTEDEDTLEFFNSLTDDEAEHMHFQAHSHVKMSTTASGIDMQNQYDVIKNMGKSGFYIFQIWNKNNDISTYLYDLDNNMFCDSKDVIIEIENDGELMSDFLFGTEALVLEKKTKFQKKEEKGYENYYPHYGSGYYGDGYYRYQEDY